MFRRRCTLLSLTLGIFLLVPAYALSQEGNTPNVSAREILEGQQAQEQLLQEKARSGPKEDSTPSTPLSSILYLQGAIRDGDFEKAGDYLDRRFLPEDMEQYSDEKLIRALSYVFNQQNISNPADINDTPEGDLKDGLPDYREQIGTVTISSGEIPIYLQRVPDGKGGKVWKVSNATLKHLPAMWKELGYGPLTLFLSEHLPEIQFMGMDNWQLLSTVLIFILTFPLAMLVSYALMRVALLIPNRFPRGIRRFFRLPMRFFLYIMIARLLIGELGLSLKARILLNSSGMDFIAWTILLLGLMSLLRDYQIRKLQLAGNTHYVALLKPFTTIVKIITVTIIALYWAKSAGYDMSTILAGLGVGSLAVALAAQKTLENIIGAVTLYTARPVSAGDFCRFGNITGTVEEIGLRSTHIRTLDRTLVVIPNSVFSSQEVENYSQRDRIRYFRRFRLQLNSAAQLRLMLAELRKLFLSHPELIQDTVSIRFEDIQDGNAILRLDAGVDTRDFQAFLAVAEDLNLRVVETALGMGAVFSGPGQLVQLSDPQSLSTEQRATIEATLQQWRDEDRLPFPNYGSDDIAALKGTLDYPPKGSPAG